MGVVYLAEEVGPLARRAALKQIKHGLDSRRVLERFEQERRVLARMDHPGIARILDAGAADDGTPYFVMEYVEGVPITTYCDQRRLSTQVKWTTDLGTSERRGRNGETDGVSAKS